MADHQCQKCGEYYECRPECDPTTFCDTCAQSIISSRLELMTPEPPSAITYESGVEILNALQKELYDRPYESADGKMIVLRPGEAGYEEARSESATSNCCADVAAENRERAFKRERRQND